MSKTIIPRELPFLHTLPENDEIILPIVNVNGLTYTVQQKLSLPRLIESIIAGVMKDGEIDVVYRADGFTFVKKQRKEQED